MRTTSNGIPALATAVLLLLCAVGIQAGDLTTDDLTAYGESDFYGPVTIVSSTNSVPTNGLLLSYDFDQDEGGIVTDQSGNNHTGTVNGATWTSDGIKGGCYSFDGTNYIELNNDGIVSNTDLTISVWVNYDAFGSEYDIVASDGQSYHPNWQLGAKATRIKLGVNNGGWKALSADESHSTGQWYHFVITRESSTNWTFYSNGFRVTDPTGYDMPLPDKSKIRIGYSEPASAHLDGRIDEVNIYNRALSEDEVKRLFSHGGGGILHVGGDVTLEGETSIDHLVPQGDLSMGTFTNSP